MKEDKIFEFILDVIRQIPKGRVTTYGAIAKCIGTAGSARVVGWAVNKVNDLQDVPAHRVVNRNGFLTGKHHFDPPSKMQELLEAEGVKVREDKVVDFKILFWDPANMLN
jgi:methylated-DNA-protein-cysteine methyltransferase-like protein